MTIIIISIEKKWFYISMTMLIHEHYTSSVLTS